VRASPAARGTRIDGALGIDATIRPEIVKVLGGHWDAMGRGQTPACGALALGRIGDKRDVPSLARVMADVDYRTNVPAIAELLSIL